jgi:S1-C subfamily serine protease
VYKLKNIILLILPAILLGGSAAESGLSGALEKELTSLIEQTRPYLVTVKGESSWRNLIATGIVYDQEGYIVTASPTLLANEFEVIFSDGASYGAEAVGTDHETGLAVLKIKGDKKFKAPSWVSAAHLKKGDWVLFVGNSYDSPSSVNIGTYQGTDEDGLLELGLNVSPGSSGGAVLNIDGEMVGVLIAMEYSKGPIRLLGSSGAAQGDYNFYSMSRKSDENALAVPLDKAKEIVDQLIEHGEIKRGYLGISQRNLSPEQKKEHGLDGGVEIVEVVEDSPADKAGLREDDIITGIDDRPLRGTNQLYKEIRSHQPGDKIALAFLRDGDSRKAEVELADSPNDYFLGSLDFGKLAPNLKVGKTLTIPKSGDLEEELNRLKDEIARLRMEFDDLRGNLNK